MFWLVHNWKNITSSTTIYFFTSVNKYYYALYYSQVLKIKMDIEIKWYFWVYKINLKNLIESDWLTLKVIFYWYSDVHWYVTLLISFKSFLLIQKYVERLFFSDIENEICTVHYFENHLILIRSFVWFRYSWAPLFFF